MVSPELVPELRVPGTAARFVCRVAARDLVRAGNVDVLCDRVSCRFAVSGVEGTREESWWAVGTLRGLPFWQVAHVSEV